MENYIEDFVEKMNVELMRKKKVDIRKKNVNFNQYLKYYHKTNFLLPFNPKNVIKFKHGSMWFCADSGLIIPF